MNQKPWKTSFVHKIPSMLFCCSLACCKNLCPSSPSISFASLTWVWKFIRTCKPAGILCPSLTSCQSLVGINGSMFGSIKFSLLSSTVDLTISTLADESSSGLSTIINPVSSSPVWIQINSYEVGVHEDNKTWGKNWTFRPQTK